MNNSIEPLDTMKDVVNKVKINDSKDSFTRNYNLLLLATAKKEMCRLLKLTEMLDMVDDLALSHISVNFNNLHISFFAVANNKRL